MPDDIDDTTPAGTPAVPPVTPPAPAATPVVRGHGGEVPEERISEIKARERRKVLRELYGTDDEDEVKRIHEERAAKAKKAEEFEAETQKRKLAEMGELDRTKEELRLEREARAREKTEYEARVAQSQTALETERQEVVIGNMASKYLAPKFIKLAKVELAEHVEGLTKAQLKEFDAAAIDKWLKKYAADNPEYKPVVLAATPPAAAPKPAAPPPKRVPVGSQARPAPKAPPAAPSGQSAPGTYKGKPISKLSKAEFEEYRTSLGRPARAY